MPKTVKSVCIDNGYTCNTNYTLNPRQLESIIKVLESSRDNLNKPQVAHISLQVDSVSFDKSSINEALKKLLSPMTTRIWLFPSNGKE